MKTSLRFNLLSLFATLLVFVGLFAGQAQAAPLEAQSRGGIVAFGTLAEFGTWEMELAPAYTRLASLRHNAARRLESGAITVATAVEIQLIADDARRALDESRRGLKTSPTEAQRRRLEDARQRITQIATLLEP